MAKYRLRLVAKGRWELRHPDGYWIGPGLGIFYSAADAMDWLSGALKREARWKARS